MNPALLVQIGNLLTTIGPIFAQEVAAVRAAGTATAEQQAALDAQIVTMDTQRMASWATADTTLDAAAKS